MQPMTYMFRMGGVSWVQRKPEELFHLCEKAIAETGDTYRLPYHFPWAIHLPNPHEIVMQLSHVRQVDGTDARDLTRAEMEGRRQVLEVCKFLRARVPEFAHSYLIETANQIGVRETRRIIGEYILSDEDVLEGQRFDDGIADVSFGVDIHDPVDKSQPVYAVGRRTKGSYQIPYRSLVPLEMDQILVAGRCISGTYVAHASYRVKGPCMAMGQAAGVAAALAVQDNIAPRRVDPAEIIDGLQAQGVEFPHHAQSEQHADRLSRKPVKPYMGPG